MTLTSKIAGALLVSTVAFVQTAAAQTLADVKIEHVLLLSLDGLHDADLAAYAAANPTSAMAALLAQGVHYDHAASAMPSDSFPGLMAILTGGSPRSTGVYYDDSYDRSLSAPGSDCSVIGTEVVFDEAIDKNMDAVDAGGGIDEALLPRDPANGCAPVYPHQFLRVNTLFEVVRAAGGLTAWADKHPSYDIVNGPSGQGVVDLFTPEIAAGGTTSAVTTTEAYDDIKVAAVLNQIAGLTHDGQPAAGVPMVFGMNFQAISVGQKTEGYMDAAGTPSAGLADALAHTDASLASLMTALHTAGVDQSTLVILTAKHGQSPIDPALRRIVEKAQISAVLDTVQPGLAAQVTADTVALIWLTDPSRTAAAVAALTAAKDALGIDMIYDGAQITAMFGDASADARIPDLILQPVNGVIYAKPDATKLAEHGGFGPDDTHVAIVLSNPALTAATIADPVMTASIAPTILAALGMDPNSLQAVVAEATPVLPGLGLTQ